MEQKLLSRIQTNGCAKVCRSLLYKRKFIFRFMILIKNCNWHCSMKYCMAFLWFKCFPCLRWYTYFYQIYLSWNILYVVTEKNKIRNISIYIKTLILVKYKFNSSTCKVNRRPHHYHDINIFIPFTKAHSYKRKHIYGTVGTITWMW